MVAFFGAISVAQGTRAAAADAVSVDDVSITWAEPPTWTLENHGTAAAPSWWYRINAKAWIAPDLDFSLLGTPVSVMATNSASGKTVFALYNLMGGPNTDCPDYADGAWVYTTGFPADSTGIVPGTYTVSEVCLGRPDGTADCRAPRASEVATYPIAPFGDGLIRAYVTAVYNDLFAREPDPAGLEHWMRALRGGAGYGLVADSITGSDEYRSTLIRATYGRYLGRSPDPAGLRHWLERMRSGLRIEDMQSGFISSPEFYARYGGTDRGWVTGLYQTVLGRTPALSEVDYWHNRLLANATRGDVARGFLYSTEHLTSVVDGYYVELLRRHIDPSGAQTWVGLIQGGERDERIIAGIISSAEYRARIGS